MFITILGEDAKEFLIYEVNDTFKLKDKNTDEVITFTVISKEIEHYLESPQESFIAFRPRRDVYIEQGEYVFKDDSNCYQGSLTVRANLDRSFKLQMDFESCFNDYELYLHYENEFLRTYEVEGVGFSRVYILRSFPGALYYSKEKGILEIEDDSVDESLFTIVE